MAELSPSALQALDGLDARYGRALDAADMDGWLRCFADDDAASYTCISAENDAAGWPIALMLDDCRGRLHDRVTFVTKVWAGTFQPYATRHFVQRTLCEAVDADTVRSEANFSIVITPEGQPSSVLATGVYRDLVRLKDGAARLLSRRAVYDTTVLPRYVVYPF